MGGSAKGGMPPPPQWDDDDYEKFKKLESRNGKVPNVAIGVVEGLGFLAIAAFFVFAYLGINHVVN